MEEEERNKSRKWRKRETKIWKRSRETRLGKGGGEKEKRRRGNEKSLLPTPSITASIKALQ